MLRRRERARGVGRPVDSVGARDQRRDSAPAPDSRQLDSHRERALLRASALPAAAHRHHRLAARHHAHPLASDPAHILGECAAGVVGLAMQRLPSLRIIPQRRGRALGPFQSQVVVADDHVGHALEDRIARLHRRAGLARRRPLQVLAHRLRRAPPHAAPLHHRDRVADAAPVAGGQARADRRQIVARHVGQNQAEHARAAAMPQQASALHGRQMPAHDIELANRGPGFEQRLVDRDLVRQRESVSRPREHRRRASAERDDHQVVGRRPMQHLARHARGLLRRFVGHRMARRDDPHLFHFSVLRPAPLSRRIARGIDGDRIGQPVADSALDLVRHRGRRLAHREQQIRDAPAIKSGTCSAPGQPPSIARPTSRAGSTAATAAR